MNHFSNRILFVNTVIAFHMWAHKFEEKSSPRKLKSKIIYSKKMTRMKLIICDCIVGNGMGI